MTETAPVEHLSGVLAGVLALREAFDAKIRYDEGRERVIESLSRELDDHRRGVYQKLLRPLLLDLVGMYDDLAKHSGDEPVSALYFFRSSLEEALRRNGVEPYTVDGTEVDRARQKVLALVDTDQVDLDRTVAERLRPGFAWDGGVLRPEWVTVFRHTPESSELPSGDPPMPTVDDTPDTPSE